MDNLKVDETNIDNSGNNLRHIIEQICSQPPKSPCTIQLMIDEEDTETVDNISSQNISDVEFDIIQQVIKHLIEILNINPLDMSIEQEIQLNQYVHSVGYHLDIEVIEVDDKITCEMNVKTYQEYLQSNCKLEHLKKYM